MNLLHFEDFEKLDIRVGKIIEVSEFPKAHKPAYQITLDFGDLGIKKTSAQLTARYTPKDLLHQRAIALLNIPPKQIGNFISECLLLGATHENEVFLVQPDGEAKEGAAVK